MQAHQVAADDIDDVSLKNTVHNITNSSDDVGMTSSSLFRI